MEICSIAIITSLFAGALIFNLGSSSITVFAQGSQNATQQQQDTALGGVLDFTQNLRTLVQESGLNTTRLEPASPDGDIMGRLQNFTEFIEAQRAGSNMTSSQ